MPRVTIQQTNFTAGEVSPRLYGRTDVARYGNGAKELLNCHPTVHGGALGRWGSRFVASSKLAGSTAILVPFVFNRDQAYILEFGDFYMRVYTPAGQVAPGGTPYEIATPYSAAMLADVDWTQGADTMFLFHQQVPVQRLQRFADDRWVLQDAPWIIPPHAEIGFRPTVSITASATGVTGLVTLTASAPFWLVADSGRGFEGPGGASGTLQTISSNTVATVVLTSPIISSPIGANLWKVLDSPQCQAKPPGGPVGTFGAVNLEQTPGTPMNGWRTSDAGAIVRLNGGAFRITQVVSATQANGFIEQAMTSTANALPGAWSVEYPQWNSFDGYPRTGILYEQRLVCAGSPSFPQTIWGSVSGQYLSFLRGVADDDSFTFTIASDQANPIQYLQSTSTLVALTLGGEFTVQGGVEKPLTPTNVQVRPRSTNGCGPVRPARVRGELLYVQRGERKVRAFSFNTTNSEYVAPDVTVLAEHITQSRLRSMAWAQERDGILWAVRQDGVLLSCTFDREQEVIGWARHITDGVVESVATIPSGEIDQVWLLVRRTINGSTVRYVERLDEGLYPDCAITGTSGPGATVWTGLGHLEGKTVHIIADGSIMPPQVVAGGQITLPRPAFDVQIGLPFTRRIDCLTPELQTGTGSAQGNAMATHKVLLRLLETTGLQVNDSEVSFRDFGTEGMDAPPESFSGIKRIENLGWNEGESPVTITQTAPYRFHVLAIIREFSANG